MLSNPSLDQPHQAPGPNILQMGQEMPRHPSPNQPRLVPGPSPPQTGSQTFLFQMSPRRQGSKLRGARSPASGGSASGRPGGREMPSNPSLDQPRQAPGPHALQMGQEMPRRLSPHQPQQAPGPSPPQTGLERPPLRPGLADLHHARVNLHSQVAQLRGARSRAVGRSASSSPGQEENRSSSGPGPEDQPRPPRRGRSGPPIWLAPEEPPQLQQPGGKRKAPSEILRPAQEIQCQCSGNCSPRIQPVAQLITGTDLAQTRPTRWKGG